MSCDDFESQDLVEYQSPVNIEIDTSPHFVTEKVFHSKDEVIDWARKCERRHGIVVVVKRSDLNDPKRNPRISLGCERGGGYRGTFAQKKRKSLTKKCGCPFNLKVHVTDSVNGEWGLLVVNGKHNHPLIKSFEGHSYIGRLTKEEVETVERLSKTGVKSRDILQQIKLKDPSNASTMKTIYNVRTALRINQTAWKSHMQQLVKLLRDHGYVTRHRSEPLTEVLEDLFWSSSTSIDLAKAFPSVFMLDCTYKTNKYRFPLLQIVGMTSTKRTFSVAFCYMTAEKEANYEWALSCFKDLFDGSISPKVFVTDREVALMNAIQSVFPGAKNLLCRFHIEKNILTNCIRDFPVKADFDDFIKHVTAIMHASTSDQYESRLKELQDKFNSHSRALSYVYDSWFQKDRTFFVSAWIDQHLHLGNTTTNRVESSHAKLKKYLSNSVSGFIQSFEKIHILLAGQVTEIKASFEDSLTRVPIRFRTTFYRELIGMVSTSALEKIEKILASIGTEGVIAEECNHSSVSSLGLPCPHVLSMYRAEEVSIPLKDVHSFWKKLSFTPMSEEINEEITIDAE